MSMQRIIKRTNYGLGCGLIVFLLLAALVFRQRPSAELPTVLPSPLTAYKEIIVEKIDVVRHGLAVDIVARLNNPNTNVGVGDLSVVFIVKDDSGAEIARQKISTFILPGSLQYVAAVNVAVGDNIGPIDVILPDEFVFNELPQGISVPRLNALLQPRSQVKIGNELLEQQKGTVTNQGTFDFRRVQVITLASQSDGKVLGVGLTYLDDLQVAEQREFTVLWPVVVDGVIDKVQLIVNTNVFRDDNIIPVVGDPALLR